MFASYKSTGLAAIAMAILFFAGGEAYAQSNANVVAPPPISGRSPDVENSIKASDVLARLLLVHENFEVIRLYMGRPAPTKPLFRAEGVSNVEMFFLGTTLKEQALRLRFELMRTEEHSHAHPPDTPTLNELFLVLDETLVIAMQIQKHLDVKSNVSERVQPESVTITDVANQVFRTGTLLRQMLNSTNSGSDAFLAVTMGVNQLMALHRKYTKKLMPDEPLFVPNKTPDDVFSVLMESYKKIHNLWKPKGQVGMFKLIRQSDRSVGLDDVSELATLLAAQVRRLLMLLKVKRQLDHKGFFGRKFPSHIHQRAALMNAIVGELPPTLTANP